MKDCPSQVATAEKHHTDAPQYYQAKPSLYFSLFGNLRFYSRLKIILYVT